MASAKAGRGLLATAVVVSGLVVFMMAQASSGSGGTPSGTGAALNSNDAPLPPQTFFLEPIPDATPAPETSSPPVTSTAAAGLTAGTARSSAPAAATNSGHPAPSSGQQQSPSTPAPAQTSATTFPAEATAPPSITTISPPYPVVVTASCYDRTISVSVASAISLPATNSYGTQPAGGVTPWLASPWRGNYEIGLGNIRYGTASFREPSFVRGGREVEVDFAGEPETVWSNAYASLNSC